MKTLIFLVSTIILVSALSKSWQELWNKEWEGFWEKDQYQRQSLAQFLDFRPEFSWFEKANYKLPMNTYQKRWKLHFDAWKNRPFERILPERNCSG